MIRNVYTHNSGKLGGLVAECWTQAGFKSQPRRCRVTFLGKLFTPIVPLFTKRRNWNPTLGNRVWATFSGKLSLKRRLNVRLG